MAQRAETSKKNAGPKSNGLGYAALVVGWLVPGAGHFLVKRWVRGLILLGCITAMFALGLMMQGKLYLPNLADPLDTLGFLGDLGSGLLYFVGHLLGLGAAPVQVVTADYGAKFVVVAGLLNLIAAVDAHNIAIGRKA